MKNIDYGNDWKLLTTWIGTEDLCQVCTDMRCSDIPSLLRCLTEQVSHLFVNLFPPMDVSLLYKLHGGSSKSCEIMGWRVKYRMNSCQCLKKGGEERAKISQAVKNCKVTCRQLVSSGLYMTHRITFAVVIQPALQLPPKTKDDKLVEEIFGLDCLHFSAQGHAAAALALWRNMLEPFGSKTKGSGDQENLKCPTKKNPHLFTKTNTKTVMSELISDDDQDSATDDFPPAAAVALAVCLTAVVVIVVVFVWRTRKSRRRPEARKLLYASGPHKPRI
ncbi:unnamed protein product [Porites lobata]|uniref:Uncharacterized protein n=1 Tax=Porites lobata TaxID=104759 RepID=A0ABN8PCQ2_9CNID|nr:unnamed protein product [Porites lobata]